jgi:dihydroorotase
MNKLILRGGRLIDPAMRLEGIFDLIIEGERIAAIIPPGSAIPEGAHAFNCAGCWITPGLVDPHVHLRDPGFPEKEDIESGLKAAAAGGFTAVAAMANTAPVNDTAEITRYMLDAAARVEGVRLIPVSAATRGLAGREPVDFESMAAAGARLFSDDGMPIDDAGVLREIFAGCRRVGFAVSLHEEDRSLSAGCALNLGSAAQILGLRGVSSEGEAGRIERDLELALGSGAAVHIAHVSTAKSLDHIRRARASGANVTCEVAPHHFTLDENAVLRWGPNAKMNPPLRSREDVDALRAGLADGTIDMVATDHAPHDDESKKLDILRHDFPRTTALAPSHAHAFTEAANGVIGLETALGLTLALVHQGIISPWRMVELMSLNPARLLGLKNRNLCAGAIADVSVIDPTERWRVEPSLFRSRSRNTPFSGMELRGKAVMTITNGKVVHNLRAEAIG